MRVQDQYKEYINTERPGDSYTIFGGEPSSYRFRIRFTKKRSEADLRTILVCYNTQEELESKMELIKSVCKY